MTETEIAALTMTDVANAKTTLAENRRTDSRAGLPTRDFILCTVRDEAHLELAKAYLRTLIAA